MPDFRFFTYEITNLKSKIKLKFVKLWKSLSKFDRTFLKFVRNVLCFAFCILILGCYGTEVVKIKVMVDSKVNIKKNGTIAVIDFVDIKDKLNADYGKVLSRMIRKQLRNSKEFHVLNEVSIDQELDEEIDKGKIEDKDFLKSICDQLEADALIVGTYDFYQVNQAVPYVTERYSSRTGTYRPETRTYIQRLSRFSLHAKVVDGKTGATIYDYNPPIEEASENSNTWGTSIFGGGSDLSSLRSIAARPVASFVLNLIPHYEYERRILVR